MEDVVAVERLYADGELNEEHPGLVLRHHLALLREAAQALEHVAVAGVLRDDVQVHVVHERLVELDDVRALDGRQDADLRRLRARSGQPAANAAEVGGRRDKAAPTSLTASSRSFWVIFCVLICFIA